MLECPEILRAGSFKTIICFFYKNNAKITRESLEKIENYKEESKRDLYIYHLSINSVIFKDTHLASVSFGHAYTHRFFFHINWPHIITHCFVVFLFSPTSQCIRNISFP